LSDLSDEKLVDASSAGDKEAYAVLTNRYCDRVFVTCLGMLGNVHDAGKAELLEKDLVETLKHPANIQVPKADESVILTAIGKAIKQATDPTTDYYMGRSGRSTFRSDGELQIRASLDMTVK